MADVGPIVSTLISTQKEADHFFIIHSMSVKTCQHTSQEQIMAINGRLMCKKDKKYLVTK